MNCCDMIDDNGEIDDQNWANCSVPDCEYKTCLSLRSDKCWAHTRGEIPVPFEEYINGAPDEEDD